MKNTIMTTIIAGCLSSAASAQTFVVNDNDTARFSITGSWASNDKQGAYDNDHTWSHFLNPLGNGNVPGYATWDVSTDPGLYEVLVRWHEDPKRATDASYEVIYDDNTTSSPQIFDQTNAAQYNPDADQFVSLGQYCDPTTVRLSNIATQTDTPQFLGYVSADAVKVVRVGDCTGSGSAEIPHFAAFGLSNDINLRTFTEFEISNISDTDTTVSVFLYEGGTQFTDTGNNALGGKIYAYVRRTGAAATNYTESAPDGSSASFTVPSKSTTLLQLFSQTAGVGFDGYGRIEWSKATPSSDATSLLVHGHVASNAFGGQPYMRSILINGGKSF